MAEEGEVRYTHLLPVEFRKRLHDKPIAYLPLGTLEWHGEHLPFGADAMQAEGFAVACAQRFGGIVLPPVYLGPGLSWWEGDCYQISEEEFYKLLKTILLNAKRVGFQAVFANGHGPSTNYWRGHMRQLEEETGLKLFGVTKATRKLWKVQVDHAAKKETSLMLLLHPELVNLSRITEGELVGVMGRHPSNSTAEYGRICLEASLEIVEEMFRGAGLL